MRAIILAASLCVAMLGHCFAQTSTAAMVRAARVEARIPSQPLRDALKQFAKIYRIQVLYLTAEVKNLRTSGASGELTADQMLSRLLRGTGLKYRYVDTNAISIVSDSAVAPARQKMAAQVADEHQSHAGRDGKPGSKLKGTDPPAAQPGPPDVDKHENRTTLDEVVVTGSRLLTTSAEGPQEVQIYDSLKIEQSGQTSTSDFLSTLPSVSITRPAQSSYASSTTVQLRGLPVGTTLVLLNGRTLEGSGVGSGNYFDLSDIPLAAVQKIEVDETGASAVYGSDAIAGVVNIILKKNLVGFAADARYEWAKDVPSWHANLALGRQWNRGGFSVIGSYETNGSLSTSQRFLSANNNYKKFGGPDNNVPTCVSGNVFSKNGGPLPGAPVGTSTSYAAVTGMTASGVPPFSQFTYGALNECPELLGHALQPSTRRGSVFAEGHLEITQAMTAFTELMYTHLDQTEPDGYGTLPGTSVSQAYTVSASNPFNPFGAPVGVTEALKDAPETEGYSTNFFRPLVGLSGALGDEWMWELSAWQSTDWTDGVTTNYFPNSSAIQSALNSSNPASALNPFVNGPNVPTNLAQALFSPLKANEMGSNRSVEAWVRGPIFSLPAGKVQAVVGGKYDRTTFHDHDSGGTGVYAALNGIATYHRRYSALFAELRVPLIHINPDSPQSRSLIDVTASGRYDRYSDFGGHTTAQVGVVVKPTRTFLIRGTYGTSFAAPTLSNLFAPQITLPNVLVRNPATGALEEVELVSGGNPSLRPLTGRSRTAGLVYSSRAVPGLSVSATQWTVKESNYITSFSGQEILNNPTDFPGRIVQNSLGNVIEVNSTYVNFGAIDVAGMDYHLQYRHRVGVGTGAVDVDATNTYHYLQALVPAQEPIESVSHAEEDNVWAPRWKATAGIGWADRTLDAHFDGRYTGSYADYASTRTIGNFWIFDANMRWSIGRLAGLRDSYLSNAYIEAGGTNIFNRGAQFSNYEFDLFGYDGAEMSILGRSLYIDIGVRW